MNDIAAFHQELYEEHLEEASFLYELRAGSLHDEELTWLDLHDYDHRIEAHLDALLGGGFQAFNMSRARALSGEAGDQYVAVRLACQDPESSVLLDLLTQLDTQAESSFQAVLTGLALGCPDTWFSQLHTFTEETHPHFAPILIRLLAWRRAPLLLSLRHRYQDRLHLRNHLSWADCRMPSPTFTASIRAQIQSEEPSANRTDAALALLQLGDTSFHKQLNASMAWARMPIALSGSQAHVRDILRATPVTTHGILALGLLGSIAAIDGLLYFLADPAAAPSAAIAINLLTGANLREEIFIPETPEEDELFEEELDTFRAGKPVPNPNGNPAGEYVIRLCQDQATWQQWWQNHGSRFESGTRYRNGVPFTPACLVDNLREEHSPNLIRVLAHFECRIRYGFHVPFEPEMPIPQQQQVIAAYEAWLEEHGTQFTAGRWYFAGEVLF